ncbi:chitinase [Photobacterium aphoticum]|uniref:Chitinase n=1 Tax=Photobacterium aphoticum TaxID=754436 RepID=A0A090QL38_9GAMM|nr:chitinase [Photobacterium aphoticum]
MEEEHMKFNRLFSGMALAGVMTLSASAFAAMTPTSDFKVVGYFPSWQGSTDAVQYDKLTHINYAFLLPNADGTLKPLEGSHTLKALVQKAHAQNVKVGIAIGGWNGGMIVPLRHWPVTLSHGPPLSLT